MGLMIPEGGKDNRKEVTEVLSSWISTLHSFLHSLGLIQQTFHTPFIQLYNKYVIVATMTKLLYAVVTASFLYQW